MLGRTISDFVRDFIIKIKIFLDQGFFIVIKKLYIFLFILFINKTLFNKNILAVVEENLYGNDHKIVYSTNANGKIFKIFPGKNGSVTFAPGFFDGRNNEEPWQQTALISINNTVTESNPLNNYTINIASRLISSNYTPVIDVGNKGVTGVINIINGYINNNYQINPEVSYIYRTLLFHEEPNPRPINYGTVISMLGSSAKLNFLQNKSDHNQIHGNIQGSNNGDFITINGGVVYGSLLLGDGANIVTLANNAYLEASKEMLTNEAAIIGGNSKNIINISDSSKIIAGEGKDAIFIKGDDGTSIINITDAPEIRGTITAINPVNQTLNVGNNNKPAKYITYGDINNINNIELNNPINANTILINNHNITGLANLTVHYNAAITTYNGSIKALSYSDPQATSLTNDSNIINNGDLFVDNDSLIYGFKINNKGSVNINKSSSILFLTEFNNSGNLLIKDKGDLSAINNTSNLTNYLHKYITIERDASIGKVGPLGTIMNYGDIIVKGNIYSNSLHNNSNANLVLYTDASVNLEGESENSGILTNNGNLIIPKGAIINASKVLQDKNLVVAGEINAPIELQNSGTTIQLNEGKIKNITVNNNVIGNLLEVYGPASTDGDIVNVSNIKIIKNNFIINNSIKQIKNNFAILANTSVQILANGDLSGDGEINNSGTITLNKLINNIGGTIGFYNIMNKFNNQGMFFADGGNVNVSTFENNSVDAKLKINSGIMSVNKFNNILGEVEILNGELSAISNSSPVGAVADNNQNVADGTVNNAVSSTGTLFNNNNQVITLKNEGKIGDATPFHTIKNYGFFNILDKSVVKTDIFENNRILNNAYTQVQLNVYGQLLVGSNNTSVTNATDSTATPGTMGTAIGVTDATAANGLIGATGATGANGVVGATGTIGANGVTGAADVVGATGTTGANGVTGATGTTDITGTNVASTNTATAMINNLFGAININSTESNYGDLSSNNPKNPAVLINNCKQTVEVHNQGTIGKVAALGGIKNDGDFLADGGDIIVGNFTNGSKGNNGNNYFGKLIINRGIFKMSSITNMFGSINILQAISDLDHNIISGDLSSNKYEQLGTLINKAYQVINVQTGTIGKYIPLGEVNNEGIMNVNNDMKIGGFNNSISTSILNITGGVSLVGDINNNGNINIANSAGYGADLSSIDHENPSSLINGEGKVINVVNKGTIGKNAPLGEVNNKGIINANGGNIIIGNFKQGIFGNDQLNKNVALKINSGKFIVGDIENNHNNSIIIKNADLSSFSQAKHSNLINRGGNIIVDLGGTIGCTYHPDSGNYSGLGRFSNYNNGTITLDYATTSIIDLFENGYNDSVSVDNFSTQGNLIINGGNILVDQLFNYSGIITINAGQISGKDNNLDKTKRRSTAVLHNYENQTINVINGGNIGVDNIFKNILNEGTLNFDGGAINTINFINNSNFNIIKGNVKAASFTNLGNVNIGQQLNTGGDLSSFENITHDVDLLKLINGNVNDINSLATINIDHNGTIGKNYRLGEIDNFGKINANLEIFKAGDINNHGYFSLTDTSVKRLKQGIHDPIEENYSIKFGKLNNYGIMILDSKNHINKIFIDQIRNVDQAILEIKNNIVINGGDGLINENNATINLSGNLVITDQNGIDGQNFINNGTLNITKSVSLERGNYILGTTGVHKASIINDIPAVLKLTDNNVLHPPRVIVLPGAQIYLDHGTEFILDHKIFPVIENPYGDFILPDPNKIIIKGSTLLVDYQIQPPTINNKSVSIVATRKTIESFIDSEHIHMLGVARSLDTLIFAEALKSKELQEALNDLENLSSKEKLVEAISQLLPYLDLPEVTFATNNYIVTEATAERIGVLARSEPLTHVTGYSAGEMYDNDSGIWIKGLAGSLKQGTRDSFPGYNATTGGVVLGADTKFIDHLWCGLGFSKVHTLVRGKDVSSKRVTLDSYQLTAYGSFSPNNYYIDGFASLSLNNYKTKRTILFIVPNEIATAKFKGVQPAFKFTTGYNFNLFGMKIIPNVSLQYSILYQNPYNEEPVNIIGLKKISSDQLKQLEGGLGCKLSILDESNSETSYNYELNMMILNDFQASPRATTAEFIGGGGSFTIPGIKPNKITYNIGASAIFKYKDSLHFTFNYDLRKKNKFIGHAGAIAVRYLL